MTTTATHWSISAAANGTTPIPFSFQAISASEVGVKLNGEDVTSFTVQINGDGTGKVIPTVPWSGPVVVYSKPNFKQPSDFRRYTPFYPDQFVPPLDRLARSIIALKGMIDEIEVGEGGGGGSDTALRSELASSSGLGLIGTPFNETLQTYFYHSGIGMVQGIKGFSTDRLNSVAQAIALSDPSTIDPVIGMHPIWGFARYAGVTGGFGYTEVIDYNPEGTSVDTDGDGSANDPHTVPFVRFVTNSGDDVNVPGTLRWCVEEIKNNGGGYVVFHPRKRIRVRLKERLYVPNNITIFAGGRNAKITGTLDASMIRYYGPGAPNPDYGINIIIAGVKLEIEGGGATGGYDQKPGESDTMSATMSYGSNKIAVFQCEVTGSTDGFFDIAGGTDPGTGASYISVLHTAVRGVDKVMGVSAGTGGTFTDARRIFLTVGRSHFEACAERKPLASSKAYIHWVQNLDEAAPFYRDYTEGTNISSVGAGSVRNGAHLLYESNIVRWGTTVAGQASRPHQGVANVEATPGAAKLIGNYFEPGVLGTSSINESYVGVLPGSYIYPELDVLADVDAAAEIIMNGAGSGRTNGPEGIYAPLPSDEADALGLKVNGNEIRYKHGHVLVRIWEPDEADEDVASSDPLNFTRGTTLIPVDGVITLGNDRYVAIEGEGGAADTVHTINFSGLPGDLSGGPIWVRTASGAVPITLDDGPGNLNLYSGDILLNHTGRVQGLMWDGGAFHQQA